MTIWRYFIFGFLFGISIAYLFSQLGGYIFVPCLVVLFFRNPLIFWFILGFGLGFFRFEFYQSDFINLKSFLEGDFTGCIVSEVDVRRDHAKYTLEVSGVETKVLLNVARYPLYRYGDCFDFRGELEFPSPIEDFRYDLYLKRYGIGYVSYQPEILKVYPREGWSFFGELYDFKTLLNFQIGRLFGEPAGGLISGILLGSRRGISEDLNENFQLVGLSHILAISGYNITILILFVGLLFGFLSRKMKVVFSIMVIVLFVLLVGAGASVVRAGIMGGISLLALFYGRQYFVGFVLLLTAFLMAAANPYVLLFDSGFHFSFMATLGLIYLAPSLEKFLLFLPNKFLIRESFLMTLSAQLMVLPLALNNFQGISLIAPIVNLMILPLIPLLMLLSALALAVSFFNFYFGVLVAFSVEILVDFLVWVVEFSADLPFSFLPFENGSWLFAGIYYVCLLFILYRRV